MQTLAGLKKKERKLLKQIRTTTKNVETLQNENDSNNTGNSMSKSSGTLQNNRKELPVPSQQNAQLEAIEQTTNTCNICGILTVF